MLAAVGIALLVAGGVGVYWYTRLDDEVKTRVEKILADQYPQLRVTVDAARIVADQGIEIRGITIVEPNQPGPRATLLEVDELFLHCSTDLTELAQGNLKLTQVRVLRPTLTATLRPDGSWSLAKLFPLPCLGGDPVPATVTGGSVRLFDPQSNPSRTYVLRDIQARIEPSTEPANTAEFKSGPPRMHVAGSAQGDYLRRIDFDGTLDPIAAQSWQMQLSAADIDFSSEFAAQLPATVAARLAPWLQLRARVDLDATIASDSAKTPWRYQLDARLDQGSWSDPVAPLPLSNLRGKMHLDPSGWRVDEMTATSGGAAVAFSARSTGTSPQSPQTVDLQIRNWQLEPAMLTGLPPAAKEAWDLLQPAGVIDVQGRMQFDGRNWKPDLTVACRDASFAWRDFPYRLAGGRGSILLRGRTLDMSIRAFAGTQAVRVACHVTDPGPNWQGFATAETEGPVAVDARLVGALKPTLQEVVQSFRPRGAVTLTSRFDKVSPTAPLKSSIVIGLVDGEITYNRFAYPLSKLRGTIELREGIWRFRELVAGNDSGLVTCNGKWIETAKGGELSLDFAATDVPLEDELRDALPVAAQQAWNSLQPRGTIDHLAIGLRYQAGQPAPQLSIRAQKWGEKQNVPGRALTVQPLAFPYRFDDVSGELEYRDGTVVLHNLRARHGRTGWTAQGLADQTQQGRSRLRLTQLTVDRLAVDNDLLQALPDGLRGGVARLAVAGQVNLRGGIEWIFDRSQTPLASNTVNRAPPTPSVMSSWDLQFDLDEGSLSAGLPIEHLHGSVRLVGASQGQQFSTRGELAVDSLICRGMQVTQIAGPLWIDNGVVALGAWAHRGEQGRLPRQITGKLFGGTLAASAQVALVNDGQFQTEVSLTDANLATVAQELAPAQRNFRGRLFAGLQLAGVGTSVDTWRGRGNIRLRDADVYELPVMLSMLKLVRVKAPDKTAFTHADADFEVVGPKLGFQRIDFEGDAITLRGKGEVTMERQIDLTFHSIVGRTDEQIPYLFPVLGEASRQILEIRVTGNFDNPQLDSKAFPALKETLEKIFPDLNRERANPWLPNRGLLGERAGGTPR